MAPTDARVQRPGSVKEAAELVRSLGDAGQPLRVSGGGTKRGWGPPDRDDVVEVHTGGLSRVLEHNEGDFTAVLEAGVRFSDAQAQFAQAGQMLAIDPPLSARPGPKEATIGGIMATADSGPLRHRFGGVRDLVLGITVVLSDGTVAKAGGRVIKNVAGYDLGKLFTGSHGTLGLIATVAVRLHPLAEGTATARALCADAGRLAGAAAELASHPLEADCLDVAWEHGRGGVLVRFAGATAGERAQAAARRLTELGLDDAGVLDDDSDLWAAQRDRQREPDGAVVKVAGVITGLGDVLRTGERNGGRVVARAGLGLSWLALPAGGDLAERVAAVRADLPGATLTVLDGSAVVRDPWPPPPAGALKVMERLKARFDPAHVFRPGVMVGGS